MKVAIVGAGPAGLLASQALKSQGVDHFLLEAGAIHPRLDPIQGVGGAGLYSDGKILVLSCRDKGVGARTSRDARRIL